MFRKVLVANRAEIAVRIMRTCRELGITSVTVYSDADRDALHVRMADEAVRIGPPPAISSYLDVDAVIEAARTTGAEAIHPGYGFLSENPRLAEACAAAGIAWVGPPAAAMRLVGDKPAARRLAADLAVPVLPGFAEESPDDTLLLAHAVEVGFPLMVKAAAGGGGRGIRLVATPEALPGAIEAARREAGASFGDARLLLERAVAGGRHVEVQVMLDRHGGAVHLGERDCSIQRRFQKVIEESPSPAVTPALRDTLGKAALRIMRAAGYENAGTVEFLLGRDGAWHFLECNTRLQVEHPITEAVAGIDLVAWQLAIAAGEPLPLTQQDVHLEGHAIECRIYAEDPARGYLPSPGRLRHFVMPADADGVRADAGYTPGSTVPTEYDALLAKVITHGATRDEAVDHARRALDACAVDGVRTNLGLLAAVLAHPDFGAGRADLTTLESMPPGSFAPPPPEEVLLAAAACDLVARPGRADPWDALGGWRLHGGSEHAWLFQGTRFEAHAERMSARDDAWHITVGERVHQVQAQMTATGTLTVATAVGARDAWSVRQEDDLLRLRTSDGHEYTLIRQSLGAGTAGDAGPAASAGTRRAANVLRAPMPGVVVQLLVYPGQRVQARQALVIIEAMKMEHTLEAPADGVVAEVHCEIGEYRAEGDLLVTLEIGGAVDHDAP